VGSINVYVSIIETEQEADGRWIAELIMGKLKALAYGRTEAEAISNAVNFAESIRPSQA
jgi:hypothetical protein